MKGSIVRKILESIKEVGISVEDLAAIMLSEGYGASYSRLQRAADKRARSRDIKKAATTIKHNYSALIYKLKKDGLIIGKERKFYLTGKGESKLALLKRKYLRKYYASEAANNFTIVAYDIPRKKNKERRWLREVLANMKFKMIQESVWMGKVKLPEDFLGDIKNLDLLKCVEIFEITKGGTLREM